MWECENESFLTRSVVEGGWCMLESTKRESNRSERRRWATGDGDLSPPPPILGGEGEGDVLLMLMLMLMLMLPATTAGAAGNGAGCCSRLGQAQASVAATLSRGPRCILLRELARVSG